MKKTMALLLLLCGVSFSATVGPATIAGIWVLSAPIESELFTVEFQIGGGSYWITNEGGMAKELLSTILTAKSTGAAATIDWVWQWPSTNGGKRKVTRISFN